MSRASLSSSLALSAFVGVLAVSAAAVAAPAKLTAQQIVDKNIAARGGLAAWRGVETLSWSGKMDAGGRATKAAIALGKAQPPPATLPPSTEPAAQPQLPFLLEMKRPRKTHLEIEFKGQTAIQVYDGTNGWKVRPFLNRHEVESFTPEELKAVGSQADLDGPLVDYAAKGTTVELDGTEQVEGKDAYKLRLTLNNKQVLHEWIDAKTFLEVKIEGTPRRLDKRYHPVFVYMRDYKSVNGLMIPHLMETRVQGVPTAEKIRIEKVLVNPSLNETRFAKPT
jgi:hypothetical protein